jgi:hypothetical protein
VVTGAIEVRFGDGMRVPVTTISETSPPAASAAAAAAWFAVSPRTATLYIIVEVRSLFLSVIAKLNCTLPPLLTPFTGRRM